MNVADPTAPVTHPRTWMGVRDILDLQLRVHGQLCRDIVSIGQLATALGVPIDIAKAIRSQASVSDLLDEIREALLFRHVDNEADQKDVAKAILSARA